MVAGANGGEGAVTNWILVPIRAGLTVTRRAFRSMLAQDIEGGVTILAIDNSSAGDGISPWLSSQAALDPRIVHVVPPKHGVAESWNYGLRWLFRKQRAPYVLVLNNDIVLSPSTYRLLVADGGPFVTAVSVREEERLMPPDYAPDPAKKRQHPDFSCFLVSRSAWVAVGEFDEGFGTAYGEDGDWHVRMTAKGIKAECLELPFVHLGANTLREVGPREAWRIRRQADANRQRFKEKYGFEIGSEEYERRTTVVAAVTSALR